MDKTRDVRRGASRFSPAAKRQGMDGGVISEKSKKERIKRLNVVGRPITSNEEADMGCCGGSEAEDERRPVVRFKLPKTLVDECIDFDRDYIPRKSRSATKKRNRDSISPPPDSEKQNHTVNGVGSSTRRESSKKAKLKMKQGSSDWSSNQAISVTISKDEEEVVETLYALAGMLSNNTSKDLESQSSEAKASALPEAMEESTPRFEDFPESRKDSNSVCPSTTTEATKNVGSLKEIVTVNSVTQSADPDQPSLPHSKQLKMEADGSALSESIAETRSEQPKQEEDIVFERESEMALQPATAVGKREQTDRVKEIKENGLLWPGLSSAASNGAGIHFPCLQSSATKTQDRFGTAGTTTPKESGAEGEKKSYKRCAAHVYTARLITFLQRPERREQMRPKDEGTMNGFFMTPNYVVNGFNGVDSTSEKNANEAINGSASNKRSPSFGPFYDSEQGFDFLCLSAGGAKYNSSVSSSSSNRGGNNEMGSSTQLHVPYLQTLSQHHRQALMPFSLPQTNYSSSQYPDQLSAAQQQVHLQLPPYLNTQFGSFPHMTPTPKTKQEQQQQQRIWAAQSGVQYRQSGAISIPLLQNWQNGRQESPSLTQCAQAMIPPPSPASLEVLGPKYPSIALQQQQQTIALTSSLPSSRVKWQYEEGVAGLQLLCNEHL